MLDDAGILKRGAQRWRMVGGISYYSPQVSICLAMNAEQLKRKVRNTGVVSKLRL